jgi:hypothetical protein
MNKLEHIAIDDLVAFTVNGARLFGRVVKIDTALGRLQVKSLTDSDAIWWVDLAVVIERTRIIEGKGISFRRFIKLPDSS